MKHVRLDMDARKHCTRSTAMNVVHAATARLHRHTWEVVRLG